MYLTEKALKNILTIKRIGKEKINATYHKKRVETCGKSYVVKEEGFYYDHHVGTNNGPISLGKNVFVKDNILYRKPVLTITVDVNGSHTFIDRTFNTQKEMDAAYDKLMARVSGTGLTL